MKAIETVYRGIKFRSKLEAQWAVFFDQCGVEWEYEPEGYDLGDGVWYLPDFVLHNVGYCRGADENGDLWVEVKGKFTHEDFVKIDHWNYGDYETREKNRSDEGYLRMLKGILVVGQMPRVTLYNSLDFERAAENTGGFQYDDMVYSFTTLDGDYWGAAPGIDEYGNFQVFGYGNGGRDYEIDWSQTKRTYFNARNYRFDHRNE